MAATIGIMLWFSARAVDRQYAEDASARTKLVLANLRSAASTVALDYSWWDEAFENIHVQYSAEWADSTFAQSTVLGPDKSVDGVLLLGPNDEILFAKWQGELLDVAGLTFDGGLNQLAAAARAAAGDPAAGPTPQAGYLARNGQVAIAGAAGLTPYEKPELLGKRPGVSVLVMLRSLTPEYLQQIGAIYGISEPRIVAPSHVPPSSEHLAAQLIDNVDARPEEIPLLGRRRRRTWRADLGARGARTRAHGDDGTGRVGGIHHPGRDRPGRALADRRDPPRDARAGQGDRSAQRRAAPIRADARRHHPVDRGRHRGVGSRAQAPALEPRLYADVAVPGELPALRRHHGRDAGRARQERACAAPGERRSRQARDRSQGVRALGPLAVPPRRRPPAVGAPPADRRRRLHGDLQRPDRPEAA